GLQFHLVELTRSRIAETIAAMNVTPGALLRERLDKANRRAWLTVFVRGANYHRIDRVLQTASAAGAPLARLGGSVLPFGDGWISYITVRSLVKGQVTYLPLAFLTDLILLSVMLKSVRT